jgi:predicted RNase H-like HicB family nuclease
VDLKINFEWNLPITLKHRKKWIVASCEALDVHSQGDTEKQAMENLSEAISIFTESCILRGTMPGVLQQLEWII